MEILFFLAIGLLVTPFVMSFVALAKVAALRQEVESLRDRVILSGITAEPPAVKPEPVSAPPVPVPVVPVSAASVAPRPVLPLPPPPPLPVSVPVAPQKAAPRPGMEFMLGGKAAAFAGAAILVMGIVFLVGYAIQHSWIGPGTRVVLGLLFGGGLAATGYGLECRGGGKYGLLARALTGAGSALFYFVVFAAYGIYHLIGAAACGVGLFVSALAVFGLAMVYHSQAVGVLGVLGAFITPLLIGGEMERGVFPLVYVAVINAPVILLGLRRKWQLLYNLSFAFTVFYFFAWLDWIGAGEYGAGLAFAAVYFLEFAVLGLLKLRCEQKVSGRRADTVRLLTASLLLLWAVYWILDKAGWNDWLGLSFLLLALLHAGLAAFAKRLLSRFSEEILAFLGGGLLFAVLALPAQLNGEWVSLGWALEGAFLAWFAVRVKSRTLLGAAALIGLIGILKALCYDAGLHAVVPNPFWNVRFAVGMVSCVLLGVQGRLAGRFESEEAFSGKWRDGLWWFGIIAGLVVFAADVFWTLGASDEWAWLLLSMAILATGAVLVLTVRPESSVRSLGSLLLGLLPLQMIWFYVQIGHGISDDLLVPFLSPVPWILLALLAAVVFWLQPRIASDSSPGRLAGPGYGLVLTLVPLACALLILTLELGRIKNEWAGPSITILWALWALALTVFGLIRRRAPYRIFGLVLFGLTTLKVLFVDSSELKGVGRIAAFMGAGVLLLVLSFVYQKAASRFLSPGEDS